MNYSQSRRTALIRMVQLSAAPLIFSSTSSVPAWRVAGAGGEDDTEIFADRIRMAEAQALGDEPIGEVVAVVGRMFLGAPYKGHTLEAHGSERLIVNLRAFDCVTFVESALSIARCVKLGKSSFGDFTSQLQLLRYRSGVIDGYPSRLHYFTDWIADNERKEVVKDLTTALGGNPRRSAVHFMSSHRSSYRQLQNSAYFEQIRKTEQALTARDRFYVPQERVASVLEELHNGDIVGMTSTLDGLDVAHSGLVVRSNGAARLLHASLSGGSVVISEGSIADYVAAHNNQDGIVVARPLEP